MKLGLWCPRLDHLRTLGPVADRLEAEGGKATWILPAFPMVGAKDTAWKLWETRGMADRNPWHHTLVVRSPEELRHASASLDAVAAVGLTLPPGAADHAPVPWCSLPYLQEELLEAIVRPASLQGWRLCTTGSADALHVASCIVSPAHEVRLRNAFVPIGWPHLDPVRTMRWQDCRRAFGVDEGTRMVLLSTAARPVRLPRLIGFMYRRRHHWPCPPGYGMERMTTYREIVEAIVHFAHRHGAHVVAKTRPKHRDPAWLPRLVDEVRGDGSFHPSDALRLAVAADVYAGTASAMAVEATAAGLPQRHVLAYPSDTYEHPEYRLLRAVYYEWPGGLWRGGYFADLHRVYRRREHQAFLDWAERGQWPARRCAPGALAARQALAPLAGAVDGNASLRFLEAVKAVL